MRIMERMAESPKFKARMGGVAWLLTAVFGSLALAFGGGLGTAVNLIATAWYAVATLIVYSLLKPVNKELSLLGAGFSLIGCTLTTLDSFKLLGVPALPAVFFGLHCFTVGNLILKSTFLPRFVGVLMVLAGMGWLTRSLSSVLSLPIPDSLLSFSMGLGVLGEMTLTVWLLARGVNEEQWREQADVESSAPRAIGA